MSDWDLRPAEPIGTVEADSPKHDASKPRWDLLPVDAVEAVVRVLDFGARKYEVDGWRHVRDAWRRYYAATMRHLTAWWRGEERDPESGEHHLAHAACCLLFLIEIDAEGGLR